MNHSDIADPIFLQALQALDSGDVDRLATLVAKHPRLVKDRLVNGEEGYFKDPYLIWFIAGNPIRNIKLPPNILEITQLLVDAVKREAPDTYHHQINYTLDLVATGRILRECNVQIPLIDMLIDAGAKPSGGLSVFAHNNIEAAQHLIDRGSNELTFAAAVCLGRIDDINRLAPSASPAEKLTALAAAAFYGNADMVRLLLNMGVDPNGYPESSSGFHCHATPLHQAVSSGSVETVALLVEAGAKLDATDKIYHGTPLGWAMYMKAGDKNTEAAKRNLAMIQDYLGKHL